jgi:hypothetical protein
MPRDAQPLAAGRVWSLLVAAITCNEGHGRWAGRALAAAAVLAALCATALLVGASADPATAAKAKLIGKTKRTPKSTCPKPARDCQAVGRLTGFQARAPGGNNPFVVRQAGQLVAWSVDLTARPKPSQRKFFGKLYGHAPFGNSASARVSVLKKKKGKKYELKSQSPAMELTDYIGEKPIFTLGRTLRVAKGDIVALTLPTWISSFAVGLPTRENYWRASRAGNSCEVGTEGEARKNLKQSRPHEKVDTTRSYGCVYRGARLLYWGYFVPS